MSEVQFVPPAPTAPERAPVPAPGVITSTPAPPLPLARRLSPTAIVVSGFVAGAAGTVFQRLGDLLVTAARGAPDTTGVLVLSTLLGGAFAGAFVTTFARHSKVLNLCVAAAWFAVYTFGLAALGAALLHAGDGLFAAAVSVVLTASAMVAGGLAGLAVERRAHARGRRREGTYRCADGSTIPVFSPWRFPRLATAWFAAAVVFFGGCAVEFVYALAERTTDRAEGRQYTSAGSELFGYIMVGLACYAMSRRRGATSVDQLLAKDTRPPVVYLRSFGDDGRAMDEGFWSEFFRGLRALINKTIEQRLAKHFGKVGPFVAIGRPGEELPELGAARVYVSDAQWQELIRDALGRSDLAVLQCGTSAGLGWELATVFTDLRPDQVLLFFPYRARRRGGNREELYQKFRAWAAPIVPGELPQAIDDTFFLYFASDPAWKVCVLRPRDTVPADHPRHELLNRLARDKVFRRPPGFSLFTKLLMGFMGLLLLVPALFTLPQVPVIGLMFLALALFLLIAPFLL